MMYATNDTIARGWGRIFVVVMAGGQVLPAKGYLLPFFPFGYGPLDEMTYLSPLLVLSREFSAQR